ncbi:MAG: response regulator [Chloroflexi bacterium]|nr:response regulator [Chloroflexota bacterium]
MLRIICPAEVTSPIRWTMGLDAHKLADGHHSPVEKEWESLVDRKSIAVLFVEDSQDDVFLLVQEIKRSDIDVQFERVQSPEALRDALNTHEWDIIISDHSMPSLTSSEALEIVQGKDPTLPVIIVSGAIGEQVAVSLMRQGAYDYLLKDRLSRLGESIRHALEDRELRRVNQMAIRDLTVKNWAIQSSATGIVMSDLDGLIEYVNPAFLDLWGFEGARQVVGSLNIKSFLDLHADNRFAQLLTSGGWREELETQNRLGETLTLLTSASVVTDNAGEPISLMCTYLDISERKKLDSLRERANILAAELEKERELRELKSGVISMLTHDFRTPLTALSIHLSLLEKRGDQMTEAERMQKFRLLHDQIKRMDDLVEEVLTVRLDEQSGVGFMPIDTDVVGLCADTFAELRLAIGTRHVMRFQPELEHLMMPVDRKMLRKALINLVSNAVKYSPDDSEITMTVKADDAELRIVIADQGIGIPETDQALVFHSYTRGGNVTHQQGTGLGLTIAKEAVSAHQGYISLESAIGQGSIFVIHLPLQDG